VALRSRNGVDLVGWFPELAGLATALGDHAAVLDGEVVAIDPEGRPSFEALQQRMASRVGPERGAGRAAGRRGAAAPPSPTWPSICCGWTAGC
jgi:ATP-dependent DNA ligase